MRGIIVRHKALAVFICVFPWSLVFVFVGLFLRN